MATPKIELEAKLTALARSLYETHKDVVSTITFRVDRLNGEYTEYRIGAPPAPPMPPADGDN